MYPNQIKQNFKYMKWKGRQSVVLPYFWRIFVFVFVIEFLKPGAHGQRLFESASIKKKKKKNT